MSRETLTLHHRRSAPSSHKQNMEETIDKVSTMKPISRETMLDMQDHLKWIKKEERKNYSCPDYLDDVHSNTVSAGQNPIAMSNYILVVRKKIVLGLFGIVDYLHIDRETVSIATSIIDRYLSTCIPAFLRGEAPLPYEIDLISLVSLHIAVKSHVGNVAGFTAPFIEMQLPNYSKESDSVQAQLVYSVPDTHIDSSMSYPSSSCPMRFQGRRSSFSML